METRALAEILTENPFFRDLEENFIAILAKCAEECRFEMEEFLFRAGEPATSFYLIRKGSASLEVYTPHRHPIPIQTLGQGELIGWSWLIPPYVWNFDARAILPTQTVAFDGRCLRQLFAEDHELGYQMLTRFLPVVAQHLRAMQMQLLEIYETEPGP